MLYKNPDYRNVFPLGGGGGLGKWLPNNIVYLGIDIHQSCFTLIISSFYSAKRPKFKTVLGVSTQGKNVYSIERNALSDDYFPKSIIYACKSSLPLPPALSLK